MSLTFSPLPLCSNSTSGVHGLFWKVCLLFSVCFSSPAIGQAQDSTSVLLATFDVNVTPPVGNFMAYDPVKRVDELTLRCRGIILKGNDAPIVLCAVDFLGIANEAHDAWREAIAAAAMTPDLKVAMAAYGDYGPCYIGTTIAYEQGGYETSDGATNVSPTVEPVLMDAMQQLLKESR